MAIEGVVHNVYVIKRPGCDEFMRKLAEHYEVRSGDFDAHLILY